jgi:hypothetical protein
LLETNGQRGVVVLFVGFTTIRDETKTICGATAFGAIRARPRSSMSATR